MQAKLLPGSGSGIMNRTAPNGAFPTTSLATSSRSAIGRLAARGEEKTR